MQTLSLFFFLVLLIAGVNAISNLVYVEPSNFSQAIQMKLKQAESPLKLIKIDLGFTYQHNQLAAYALTGNTSESTYQDIKHKKATVFTSLIHPREETTHIALATFISDMIEHYNTDIEIQYVLNKTVVIAFPFVNIDGYLFTKNLTQKQKELVRKNRNVEDTKCMFEHQKGIDINRNFDIKFGTVPQSSKQCGQQYHGVSPFSQPQAIAIRKLFQDFHVTIALDLHSYGGQFIYPFAYDKTGRAIQKSKIYPNYEYIIKDLKNRQYKVQSCWKSLSYIADGVYIDWALATGALSFAYQFGSSFKSHGQIKDKEDIFKAFQAFYRILKLNGFSIQAYKQGENILYIQSYSFIDLPVNITFGQYSQTLKINASSKKELKISNEQIQINQMNIKLLDTNISKTFILQQLKSKETNKSWSWLFLFLLLFLILAAVGVFLCLIMACLKHFIKRQNEKVLVNTQQDTVQFTGDIIKENQENQNNQLSQ